MWTPSGTTPRRTRSEYGPNMGPLWDPSVPEGLLRATCGPLVGVIWDYYRPHMWLRQCVSCFLFWASCETTMGLLYGLMMRLMNKMLLQACRCIHGSASQAHMNEQGAMRTPLPLKLAFHLDPRLACSHALPPRAGNSCVCCAPDSPSRNRPSNGWLSNLPGAIPHRKRQTVVFLSIFATRTSSITISLWH